MIRSFAICLEIAYELLVPRDLEQLLDYASITFLPNFGLRNEIIIIDNDFILIIYQTNLSRENL